MRRRRRLAAAQLALLLLATGGDVASGRRKKAKPRTAEPPAATTAPSPATHTLPFAELPPLRAQPPSADGPLPELGLPPDFMSTAWDKSARLIRLGPSAFEGMMDLSRGDLDALIESNTLKMGEDAQFSKDGAKGSGNSPTLTVREAHWRLDDGASVLVSALEKFWPPAMPLVRPPPGRCTTEPEPEPDRSRRLRVQVLATQRALRFYSSINMYVTPPSARGFDVHFDYEDVIIIQVHGSKRWRLWEPDRKVGQLQLPLRSDQRTLPVRSLTPGPRSLHASHWSERSVSSRSSSSPRPVARPLRTSSVKRLMTRLAGVACAEQIRRAYDPAARDRDAARRRALHTPRLPAHGGDHGRELVRALHDDRHEPGVYLGVVPAAARAAGPCRRPTHATAVERRGAHGGQPAGALGGARVRAASVVFEALS